MRKLFIIIAILLAGQSLTIYSQTVTSISGTANQIITSSAVGDVSLSLPQSIAPANSPIFAGMTLNGALIGTSGSFSYLTAPNIVYGGEGGHTFLGTNSSNSLWRASFYTGFNTPGLPNTGDFGFVNIPTWGGQSSSASRYNLQIGANIGAVPVYRNTAIDGSGSWYTFYTSQNFNPADYLLRTGGILTGTLSGISAFFTGSVGIGTSAPDVDSKLTVAGKIHSREVKVSVSAGADFVFEKDYPLKSLAETEHFIAINKRLPEIASAADMRKNGLELGQMNIKLLQKVEELTLHLIQLNKTVQNQQNEIRELKAKL